MSEGDLVCLRGGSLIWQIEKLDGDKVKVFRWENTGKRVRFVSKNDVVWFDDGGL